MTYWPPSKIKGLRESLAQTQVEFARSALVSAKTVTNWERGVCAPSELAEWRLSELNANKEGEVTQEKAQPYPGPSQKQTEPHTPGEWKIHWNPGARVCWEGHENPATIVSGDKFIATIQQQGRRTAANARLIKAAPKMFAALRTIRHLIQECERTGPTGAKIQRVIDKAIARVEGE